jgi:O-antigen ligase
VRASVGGLQATRLNAVLLVFISLAVVAGALAGLWSNLSLQTLFRVLVLSNILLVGYIVLIRNVVAGLLVYLYSLVFLNYYWRIVLPGVWPDIDLPRMLFVFVWLVFLLEILLGRRRLLPGGAVGIMMLLLMTVILASMVVSGHMVIRVFLNGYVIPYAMFAISRNVLSDRRAVDRFIFWLAIPLALYFPLTSILEHYKVYGLLFPRYIGKAMAGDVEINWGGRAMGAFIQPAVTGMAMAAMFVLALYALSRVRSVFASLYKLVLVLVTPIGIFFTYTRSVYLGFVGALMVLVVMSRRLRLTALILLVALGLAVIGNWSSVTTANREQGGVGEVSTAQARVVVFQASMMMFREHPILGCGFDQFIKKAQPYVEQVQRTILGYREAAIGTEVNQHNQFVSILTELGLVGFIPFVLIYVLLFHMLFRARRADVAIYDSEFVVAVLAVMTTYVAAIMFIEPRWFEFMNTLPFMLMGIVAGGYERAALEASDKAAGPVGQLEREYVS